MYSTRTDGPKALLAASVLCTTLVAVGMKLPVKLIDPGWM